ncbi:hypothetical protein Gogos_017807, partial [Gossypium gossypioides]|nr:hypothetical protein [Gossypium gossypioides]
MAMPLQPYSVGSTYSAVWLGVMPYYGLITLRLYSQNWLLSIPFQKQSLASVLQLPIFIPCFTLPTRKPPPPSPSQD